MKRMVLFNCIMLSMISYIGYISLHMVTYSTLLDFYILFNYRTYVINYVMKNKYDYLENEYKQKQTNYILTSEAWVGK